MSELSKYLEGIDQIKKFVDFIQEEYDATFRYCRERNFILSEEDMETIKSIGFEKLFESWKKYYKDKIMVEITMEKVTRVAKQVYVTAEELDKLKEGENIFQNEMEKELKNGDVEYDYAVNDENGNEIVPWSW